MNELKMIHETFRINNTDVPVQLIRQTRTAKSIGAFLHWHEQIEIYYVVSGGLSLLCNGVEEWIYGGDIGFVNWCEPHRGTGFIDDTVFFTIQINLSRLDSQLLEDNDDFMLSHYNQVPTYIHSNLQLKQYFQQLIQIYQQPMQGSSLMIKGLLYLIFGTLVQLKDTPYTKETSNIPASLKMVRRMLKYIASNYNKALSLSLLSHEFSLSKSHLSHIFKEHTGQTVHQYINDYRCQMATTLLKNKTPLSEVCYAVGFNDYNYFSRVFKKAYGVSPKNYH